MHRMTSILGLGLVGILLTVGVGVSQDKEGGKIKGMLPPGWKTLKLTETQKQRVYEVQSKYRAKIEALEQQINDLKNQSRVEMAQVLTAEQKTLLRKLTTGEEGKKTTTGEKEKK